MACDFKPMRLWFRVVKFCRFPILLLWLGIAVYGSLRASTLFDNLEDELEPKDGSRSVVAYNKFWDNGLYITPYMVIMIESERPGSILTNSDARQFVYNLQQFYTTSEYDYYQFNGTNNDLVKNLFVLENERAQLAVLDFTYWYKSTRSEIESLIPAGADHLVVSIASVHGLDHTDGDAAQKDLEKMDAISIPVAVAILIWRVRNVSLMIIPIFVLVFSLTFALAMLAAASENTNFPGFAPALFISTAIAMGFDWSLFMLTRYREEIKKGKENDVCVQEVVEYAGHTVLLSGLTLCISYVSLTMFPVAFLSAVGFGALLTLIACILVNLTLTPALLLIFPGLFSNPYFCCCDWRKTCCRGDYDEFEDSEDNYSDDEGKTAGFDDDPSSISLNPVDSTYEGSRGFGEPDGAETRVHGVKSPKKGDGVLWFKVVTFAVRYPWYLLIGILICSTPLMYYSSQFKYSSDKNQLHPRNTDVYHDWRHYSKTFPSGFAWPYSLLAEVTYQGIEDPHEHIVNANNALVLEISEKFGIAPNLFQGPTWTFGPLTYQQVKDLYNETSEAYHTPEAYYARFRNQGKANSQLNPTYFTTEIDTPFDPQGNEADDFISGTRDLIDRYNSENEGYVHFYLANGLGQMYDVADSVFDMMPLVVGLTCIVLLVFVAISFRSMIIALRLIFTVVLTLSWCIGGAVIVFQTSLFDSVDESMEDVKAFFWMAPVLTISLIIGLALDYDLFLLNRIREFKETGDSDTDAIVKGYWRTGGVITTAGIIMVVAFGSLMMSSQLLVVEAGFFLSFSVLLDTFIVRSLLVPAMLVILGRWNWWPSAMSKLDYTPSKSGSFYGNERLSSPSRQSNVYANQASQDYVPYAAFDE